MIRINLLQVKNNNIAIRTMGEGGLKKRSHIFDIFTGSFGYFLSI